VLIVYAEAFERDANPEDFSLAAILAHERDHQLLARHARIAKRVKGRISDASEEILVSVLGSLLCEDETDRDSLMFKAVAELIERGESADAAFKRLQELRDLFEALL
jgi:predicted Zn-dependent protease